jgi:hypothetical protein
LCLSSASARAAQTCINIMINHAISIIQEKYRYISHINLRYATRIYATFQKFPLWYMPLSILAYATFHSGICHFPFWICHFPLWYMPLSILAPTRRTTLARPPELIRRRLRVPRKPPLFLARRRVWPYPCLARSDGLRVPDARWHRSVVCRSLQSKTCVLQHFKRISAAGRGRPNSKDMSYVCHMSGICSAVMPVICQIYLVYIISGHMTYT